MKAKHILLLTLCFIFTGCGVTTVTASSVNTKHEVKFDQDEDEYDTYEYYAPKLKENK